MLRPILLSIIFISTLLISMLVKAQPPAGGAPPPMPVETAPVKVDTVTIEATAVGSLRAEESLVIRSEIAGRILTFHFNEGQTITEGKPLITLDPAEYKAQLSESAAAVSLNELNFERTKDLFNKNLSSRQAFDEAKAKLDESRARQALDQVRLEKTVIHAPFKGILGLRNISQGSYVKAGDDLVSLGDSSSVKLDFRVPERYFPQVHLGQTVNIQVDAYPGKNFTGTVYTTDTKIDEETRTILVRARIPNPNILLIPGMFARVSLILEKRENALLIPEQAIVPQGQAPFVFKVTEGKVYLVPITLGQRRTGDVEVLKGLNKGDVVVTSGQMKLRDGAEVMSLPAPSPSAVPNNK